MKQYEKYMKLCFKLARKGEGSVSPNPLVGCVILDKNNNIISTGYHQKYGENHAERNALLKLKKQDAEGATLIVNLEPCNHYGKTPPCTDLIIEYKIKRVVIGSIDPNPKASGGIQKLNEAGIEVIKGVLEEESNKLNEIFFTNINKKRTFIALKTATTIDGKIATQNGDSKWITSKKARNYAKKLRHKYDAILTSSSTVINDNPEMLHKTKIVLDRTLKCDLTSKIFKNGQIYVFTEKTQPRLDEYPNIEFITTPVLDNKLDLDFVLSELYKRKIMSVFVEAGGKLLGSFINKNMADKIYHFIAPKILNDNDGKSAFDGDNIDKIANAKCFKIETVKRLTPDILLTYKKTQ